MTNSVRINKKLAKQYEQWMIAMHYAKTTQTIYRKTIRQYIDFMGKKSIADADHIDIRRYIASVSEDGASLSAVYRDLGTLRLFYDFLHLGGVVHYVAPRFVKLRRPWFNSSKPLTKAQIRNLIAATRTPRDSALIELFYATGCRLSEVARLKIEEIDFGTKAAEVVGKF